MDGDDFFVAPPNELAVARIEDWRAWPSGRLMLVGPEGAGKTHLAAVWCALAEAACLDARAVDAKTSAPLAIEDVDRVAGDRVAEERLFHFFNRASGPVL